MPPLRFHVDSSMSPAEVMGVLTNFGPSRVEEWPSIDAELFQVHERGDTWAEVTEGNGKSWERARYERDVRLDRHPTSLKAKITSSIIPFAGPVFRKSFREPLHTT
ncbi:hypothetical protein [Streptomyces sp. NPDC005533]|uniref:hypothetical protein n=1 Tax=Streptomyces sp. NPDC005533 TaxID=3364723 RepID=UPI0036D0CC3E